MFIDEVQVTFRAGKGGDGAISWRREKYIPNGGPYGGDGGDGGDIVLQSSPHLNTLMDFRHKKIIEAEHGERGGTNTMHGKSAEDLIIPVPVGTLVSDAETGELIADLSKPHQSYILCKGGKGGFGNAHFTASTRQAPNFAEIGDIGEEKYVRLELKLVADVGLVGLPNAGKSSLIQAITNVKPKIAPYPFTTLIPNLGVMEWKNRSLVIEDIPGLIEGASEGKGLGDQFLKHIERTRLLLHLVDISLGVDVAVEAYETIRHELETWDRNYENTGNTQKVQYASIREKEECIILSKADLIDQDMLVEMQAEFEKKTGKTVTLTISAPAYIRTDDLKNLLILQIPMQEKMEILRIEDEDGLVHEIYPETEEGSGIPENTNMRYYDLKKANDPRRYTLTRLENGDFEVTGERIEEIVRMTDMKYIDGVNRVYDIMEKLGIMRKMKLQVMEELSQGGGGFFEGEEDFDTPNVWISGKKFPLEGMLFRREA